MASITRHLNGLIGSLDESSEGDRRALEEWTKLPSNGLHATENTAEEEELASDGEWNSVLDIYRNLAVVHNDQPSALLSKLLLKPDSEPLLASLRSLLSSTRPDDAISGELVDTLGFEDMDLVMEILGDRTNVARELSDYLDGNHVHRNAPRSIEEMQLYDVESARLRMEETMRENANRPLFSGSAEDAPEVLPHVYTSSTMAQGNILSQLGTRYVLPIELEPLAKGSFPGKTDVAMLTVLRVLDQHRSPTGVQSLGASINRDDFKIIYVAPMKALAAEIVRKLGKRLQWLSIRVRELTGDMQLTKSEIAETQIIVTTPEKWDVVTRKPTGEGELASASILSVTFDALSAKRPSVFLFQKVKLLIIDEVHLLNDERGAVIETIVARTLRQVESSQSIIRIVGLSATLPNYIDVADFLRVNRHKGLFYFDSSFRPVPLEQHFIGVRGKPNGPRSRKNMDRVTFDKVAELVHEGHQVMVFVHARKETVKTALALKEAALAEGSLDEFSCEEHPSFSLFRRDIGQSRNKEMKQLFDNGFGIHHAGMLRSDRNMMERMFEARAIKVLCCTATLAWGVNLPAHAVIIKGTQVYDSAKGSFVDLSVLDVLQVFGRAGRPGLETSGVGYICTTEDKLTDYLNAVTSQNPIESQFTAGMIDSLNAEIALGTVANVHDAVQWLGYTYLVVRIRKNPFQYGLTWDEVAEDRTLGAKRSQLVTEAAKRLSEARMIAFDRQTGAFAITDLGRISAKYYIRHASIEVFNKEFKPKLTEADVLNVLSMSTEFNQIQVRENEVKELKELMEDTSCVPCTVKSGTDDSKGKVNILLQAYISKYRPEDFALVSDQAYAAQNGGRIIRALLEIAISRKWASASAVLMGMSKAIEKRLWPFDQPLKQFELKADIFYNLERFADDYTIAELAALSAAELGELVHLNERHGSAIKDAAKQFPTVRLSYDLRPLGSDVLKITVHVTRMFNWSSRVHGTAEPFWLWIEDHDSITILQLSHLVFRQTTTALNADFVISVPNGQPPPFVTIRFVSDRWMGAEDELAVPFDDLIMPAPTDCHSPRLDIPFLSLNALQDSVLQDILSLKIRNLNAIQSQTFWSLTNTRSHSLLCAPTGCGKSLAGQLTAWRTLRDSADDSWVLIVAPRRSIVTEILAELRPVCKVMGFTLDLITSEKTFTPSNERAIRLITASNLLSLMSRGTQHKALFSGLRMVLCENLELLDPAYELGISTLMHETQQFPVRYVGLSNSLNDPADLAAWLNVDPSALHSFRPNERDQALTVSTTTFTIPQSAALFKAMAKPAHAAIQSVIRGVYGELAIVFVPSRSQCRSVALDLITQIEAWLISLRVE
ncbi:hypothetical protein EW026_g463 [Hermanssonia centrifuga]|uniref:Activating signal cointegrator 1 complex subunit 3 n=1 Tax=Hermanssonia centrifuga TaxID=98765 RepID=A0A4S4KUL3_9APHY|nr:hypothetical protein EW026_g463 [Hermanssonia centrifuga]